MLRILFLLFLLVPLIEIYLLIKVGGVIGALPTVLLVVATALLGAVLLRWQGFSTMQKVRQMMARGELPAIEMLEGVVLLLSGALLLTPGFFTDTLGFLCLIPPLRRALIVWLLRHSLVMPRGPGAGGGFRRHDHASRTIEGEFWHDDERR